MSDSLPVYLEIGKSRTLAGALDWPGWCRGGRDADQALHTLVAYGPRYAGAIKSARLNFRPPAGVEDLMVVERLEGEYDTDYGIPGKSPGVDSEPVNDADLERFTRLLRACWGAFDDAVAAARDKPLRAGARGGGRDLTKIITHVLDGDGGYLWRLASRKRGDTSAMDLAGQLELTRNAILDGLAASARGEVPAQGPRGGKRWTVRYFVRRATWHVLDHAWEIEDRLD